MDIQLKKGVWEYCLLEQISKKETYGYDLLRVLSEAFSEVQESTIYAILRRLRSGGLTETYDGDRSDGPVRKYYRITPLGQKELQSMRKDWSDLVAGVTKLCGSA